MQNFPHTGPGLPARGAGGRLRAAGGAGGAYLQGRRAMCAALNARLSAVYQKAFYETCELMEGMSTNLRKLLVTGSAQQNRCCFPRSPGRRRARRTIFRSCRWARRRCRRRSNSSIRPGTSPLLWPGSWRAARPSATRTMRTSPPSSESAGQLSARLGQLLSRYESGEDIFAGDMGQTGEESLYPLTDPAVSYPALLYDGPLLRRPPGRRSTVPLKACPLWTRPERSGRCAPIWARGR